MSNASTGNTSSSLSSRCRFLTEMSSIMIKKRAKPVSELIRVTFYVKSPVLKLENTANSSLEAAILDVLSGGTLSAEFVPVKNVRHVLRIKTVLKIQDGSHENISRSCQFLYLQFHFWSKGRDGMWYDFKTL